ncbi:hypothetical protein BB558_003615 [Smittium angustum]|uniref:Topoisomerase I damage affected protein 2 n=1 Tax=Smittium angustum TaxID=133377 RepID=A0A2U1J5M7_SMIAN|nr:hypothetical protein BB558_003615 [Smittium angustum]
MLQSEINSRNKFDTNLAKKVTLETIEKELENVKYDKEEISEITKTLADKIQTEVLARMNLKKHKILVNIIIGESRDQGLRIGTMCKWDQNNDGYAEIMYTNVRNILLIKQKSE